MSFKKCPVIILATNQKAPVEGIIATTSDNKLQVVSKELVDMYKFHQQFGHFAPVKPYQHLYILSDDEIKEDDWYLFNGSIYQLRRGDIASPNCKKIIATTDKSLFDTISLGDPNPNDTAQVFLPTPSQVFIEKYIKEYNNGSPITDVLVEYWAHTEEYPQLRIDSKDNTITIKKVKDSWSREEVKALCNAAFYRKDLGKGLPYDYTDGSFNQWSEANL